MAPGARLRGVPLATFGWARATDWKLLAATSSTVSSAGFGDKAQSATPSLSAGCPSRLVDFAGSAPALDATSAIGVLAGEAISRAIPPDWLCRGAGVAFLVMGVLFLPSRGEGAG